MRLRTPRRQRVRAATAVAAALITSAGLAIAPSATAHADDSPLAVCPGWVQQTIDPGLTVLPTFNTVTVSGTFGPCANQIIDPDHTYAEYTSSASGELSCTINAPITNASGTIVWEDQSHHHTGTSHFTGGITISQRPVGETVGIVAATINSGDYAGHLLNVTSARLNFDPLQCLTSGLKSVAGPGTLNVLP